MNEITRRSIRNCVAVLVVSLISVVLMLLTAPVVVLAQASPVVGAVVVTGFDSVPRLHVRPHHMVLGTRTRHAGWITLPQFPGYILYVPRQCVGPQRSPLILLLHGGGSSGQEAMTRVRPLADIYGMIVLAGNATTPGRWDVLAGMQHQQTVYDSTARGYVVTRFPDVDVQTIDRALAYVLHTQAIDPNRIGIVGFSDGGSYALFLGRSNEKIFSRIAALSALIPFTGTGPENPQTQFLVSGGIAEHMIQQTVKLAQLLRRAGHPVVTMLGLRGHVDRVEDEAFVWQWLKESWADSNVTTPHFTLAYSDPVLTETALARLTVFWTRFQQEPDSIRTTARRAHQTRVPLMLGVEPAFVVAMDLPVLASMYPSVAADLRAAGLTAHEAMVDRTAVLRVGFTRAAGMVPDAPPVPLLLGKDLPLSPIPPTSVLGRNLAFRQSHAALFQALGDTWMWTTP